jgi:hypothetical protein
MDMRRYPVINWNALHERLTSIGPGFRRPAANRAVQRIDRVIEDLEALDRSTERDFLAVGDKLIAFRSTAHDIAADLASVTELIAGEEARRASQTLSQLLDESKEIDSGLGRSAQALEQVRELAIRLRRGFSGLANLVAVFGNLCTLTQIETARLGGAGADLGHLAAEVRPLSESIQRSGESVLAASARLDAAVQGALRTGSALRAAELKQMPALVSGVLASLQAFEQQRRVAAEASRHQAAEYAALSHAIEELVASIQFHDITRQQVEHVIQALRAFRAPGGKSRNSSLGGDAHAVLTLQSSQLREAARLFADSIGRIEQVLASLAPRFRQASDQVHKLTGASEANSESFFSRMEAQFAAVLKILDTCAAAQTKMESTIAGLAGTINGMSASVADIRRTEIQIQRISTNATIRAIHIGATGVALNKIAEVMQHLALDSNAHTDEAAAALEGMRQIATGSGGPAQNAADSPEEHPMAAGMRAALAGLHSSSESSASRAGHIGELGRDLAQEIITLREGVSAGRLFAEVAARAIEEMDSIAAEARPAVESSAGTREHLDHLAETYTMERQREVHASVLALASKTGAPAFSSPADTMPEAASSVSDLGDNIELF